MIRMIYLLLTVSTIVTLCGVAPGVMRACKEHSLSAESFRAELKDEIEELEKLKGVAGVDIAGINEKINKLRQMEKHAVKDGMFFTVYDRTIGRLMRKITAASAVD